MPTLRQLDCHIEWANTGTAFDEYGTAYGDGIVETYIVIPELPQTFSISLSSKGYIDEGLAVVVFIDGEYQCNRNRLNLRPHRRDLPRNATEIQFRLRQKETPVGDGSFIGREWRFDTHNAVTTAPQDSHAGHFDNLGNIEIIVLRCRNSLIDDNKSTSSSGVDSDPMSKYHETEDAEENPEDQHIGDSPPQSTNTSTVEDGGGFLGGFFDGTNDRRGSSFGGDGPTDGYWTYHHYPQHYSTAARDSQWVPHHEFNPAPSYPIFPPGQAVPVPSQEPVPEKHVHFDMGGPPNTRAGPPHQQWPEAPLHPPTSAPPQTPPSNLPQQGAGHWTGYPIYVSPVPFDGIPPYSHPHQAASYGGRHGSTRGGYMSPANQYYGYGPSYGGRPNYAYFPNEHNQQGLWYGHGQGQFAYGPAPQDVDPTKFNNSGDPAKDENNPQRNWGTGNTEDPSITNGWNDNQTNNNTGGVENHTENANNDTSNATVQNDDWANNNTSNDDTQWANNQNSGDGQGWGEAYQAQSSNQEDQGWNNNNDSTPNNQDQNWGNNDQENSKPPHDTWSQAEAAAKADEAQEQMSQVMPGTFPPIQPRALYGPHGPYYMLKSVTVGEFKPEVEEGPRFDVPMSHIAQTGSTHQVQPGQGYLYLHKRGRPFYIDSIENPYARFVFKYRTKAQIANEIGVQVDMDPSSNSEMQSLASKTKEEIIDMLLRAKSALGGKIPEPPEKTKEQLDDPRGLQPTVIPVPERRFRKYDIPIRPTRTRPQSNNNNGADANATDNHWTTLPQYANCGQNQNQNQNQSWDNGGSGQYGDPGARPASPEAQNGNWGNGGGNGGVSGGGAAAAPSAGW